MFNSLSDKIKKIKPSIVAIGFKPAPNQITILGSGFYIGKGKIMSVAHLFKEFSEEKGKLVALVMKEVRGSMEGYAELPLKVISKDEKNDLSVCELSGFENTLLREIEIGDSENVDIGDPIYFIGFPYAADLMNEGWGVTLIVNKGIVSNIKVDGQDPEHPRNFIIIDAISNPGISGAPLIDENSNKVVGVMAIAFRMKSKVKPDLDIREPMHICAARPINLAKDFLK